MEIIKKLITAALFLGVSIAAFEVRAETIDPAQLFGNYIERSAIDKMQKCTSLLTQSWANFSGSGGEYKTLENEYLNGAAGAAVCGIRRGYEIYILLGELQKVRKTGVRDLQTAAREAERRFDKMPISSTEDFMAKVDCRASTPVIRFSGYFSQTVQIACTTPMGPAAVDLTSLHISVAGRDVWNGRGTSYFGRSI